MGKNTISCEAKAMKADDVSYAMMGLTGLFTALAVLGAAWVYLAAAAHRAKKNRDASAAAAMPLPSPGYKPVALTVKSPTKEGGFQDIPLEESKTSTPQGRGATTQLSATTASVPQEPSVYET